jgi:hypothetical protein
VRSSNDSEIDVAQAVDGRAASMARRKWIYALAQEQHNSALMIGACRTFAAALYYSGDFESARQYAMRGVEI